MPQKKRKVARASSQKRAASAKKRKTEDVPPDAQTLCEEFQGRICMSSRDAKTKEAHKELLGEYTLLFPHNADDVTKGIQIANHLSKKLTVVSGTSQSSVTEEVNVDGALVVNMKALNGISVKGSEVTVGAAATTHDLAVKLVEKKLFLPLAENCLKSVVSNVLSHDLGYFGRSVGLLKDFVVKLQVSAKDGSGIRTYTKESEGFDNIVAGGYEGIVTSLTFQALSGAEANKIWMAQYFMPYENSKLEALVKKVSKDAFPKCIDVTVRYFDTGFVPMVQVTVAGKNPASAADLLAKLHGEKADVAEHVVTKGHQIVGTVSQCGEEKGIDTMRCNRKFFTRVKKGAQLTSLCANFLELTAACGDHFKDIKLNASLSLGTDSFFEIDFEIFYPHHPNDAEKQVVKMVEELFPTTKRNTEGPEEPQVAVGKGLLQGAVPPGPRFMMPTDNRSGLRSEMKHFQGRVYLKGDPEYTEHTKQYASSSYPDADWMRPYMVAYPVSEADVSVAVLFAKTKGLKVVARSGGHQYCGFSSGDSKTIVLSMDNFNKLEAHDNIATVGVGSKLQDLADFFRKQHVTIPHGECPLVCIGGHAQTGGFGHIARSHGVALDYVESFRIVVADGTVQNIVRPSSGRPETSVYNDDIYWGVLGGGPGSFGITTEYTFEALRDSDHPYSSGHAVAFIKANPLPWISDRWGSTLDIDVLREGLMEVARWTHGKWTAPSGKLEKLPDDVDLMMTALSGSLSGRHPPLVAVECEFGNVRGAAEPVAGDPFEGFFKNLHKKKSKLTIPGVTLKPGPHALSEMSYSFVRIGHMGHGREFSFPYKKRVNATLKPISDEFVEEFVELCEEVQNTRWLFLSMQLVIGGGKLAEPDQPGIAALNRRNAKLQIIFDVFYEPSHEDEAIEFQERMQDLLEEFSGGEDLRMIWGSFDAPELTDLRNPEVVDMYYDSKEKYQMLQRLKKRVDPTDVFHTPFTVQLPEIFKRGRE